MTTYIAGTAQTSNLTNVELRVISQLIQQDQGGKNAAESLALVRNDIAQSLGYPTPVPGDT